MGENVIVKAVSSDIIRPLLINWEHGRPLVEGYDRNNIQCEILTEKGSPDVIAPVISVQSDGNSNIYVGKKERGSDLCRNFLVVRNKDSGEIRMYAADSYFMARFQPQRSSTLETGNTVAVKSDETSAKAVLDLNKAFAAKKVKRRMRNAEKMNVTMEDIQDKLKSAIKENQIDAVTDTEKVIAGATYLPPCNRDATTIEGAYNLFDLISPDEFDSVHDVAVEVLDNGLQSNSKMYSKFLLSATERVPNIEIKKFKILLIVDTFIQFLKIPYKRLKAKNPVVCPYSNLINEKLVGEFCVMSADGRCRPNSMKDKTLCYIIVLLFIAYGYKLDISLLSGHVGSGDFRRLPALIKAVGGKQEKKSQTTYTLRLPLGKLSIPRSSSRGMKRKHGG